MGLLMGLACILATSLMVIWVKCRSSGSMPAATSTASVAADPSHLLWYCQFDVSPVNYSDSDSDLFYNKVNIYRSPVTTIVKHFLLYIPDLM